MGSTIEVAVSEPFGRLGRLRVSLDEPALRDFRQHGVAVGHARQCHFGLDHVRQRWAELRFIGPSGSCQIDTAFIENFP
jgi:hypothetical protein